MIISSINIDNSIEHATIKLVDILGKEVLLSYVTQSNFSVEPK